jgi:Atypical PilZ domain, cyclic di-GMP receptor
MEGIHLEARIPLQWRTAEAFPEATLARWNATNIVLLRALAVLDAGHVAHEHGAEQGQDRLEAKLDLLVALFSQLILRDPTTPAEAEVELGNMGLAWHDEAGPEPGAQLALSLYLSPKLPLPLTMPARVAALQPRDHGLLIQAEFMSMPREFQELWEQTLFRMHRREIQARRT